MGKKTGKLERGLSVCLWSFVADFPECSARVKRTWPSDGSGHDPARARARARELARSLWAGNIETQDVLLCHPRAGDLLVMNIVAHGGTWPARPRGVLPKYVRRLARSTFLLPPPPPSPCTRPYSFHVTWTFYDQNFYSRTSKIETSVVPIAEHSGSIW